MKPFPKPSSPFVAKLKTGALLLGAWFSAATLHANLLINEMDADQAGTDTAEFIELYSNEGVKSLDGYVLVFFNGANASDGSYNAIDLDGFSTNAGGYFLLGNAAVGGVQITLPANALQNGVDGIALYRGNASDFAPNTPPTTANLVDAIVYGAAGTTLDTGLLNGLGRIVQRVDDTTNAIARVPDGSGNLVAQLPTPGAANGGTADATSPVLAATDPLVPANGATGVPVAGNLVITFDEEIAAGTGNIVLYREQGAVDAVIETFPVANGLITEGKISFNPAADFVEGAPYYVVVDSGAIRDLTGNSFAGIAAGGWTFTAIIPDVLPPVAALHPADNNLTAVTTANLTLSFNEPVTLGTGTITLRKADASVVETFDVTGPRATLVNNVLALDPTNLLDPSTSYHVEVPAGVVVDAVNLPNAAITGTTGWNFTTRGAPAVVINQYYEGVGTGQNRFIELRNLTGSPVPLDGYRLVSWTSSDLVYGNQGWKTGNAVTERSTDLTGHTIPANGYYLIGKAEAETPGYAVNNNDLLTLFPSGMDFSGTASVVLYSAETNDLANVVDAISITASEGADISFYRLTNATGFDFTPGNSITLYPSVWGTKTVAEVDAAASTDDWFLRSSTPGLPFTLSISPTTITEDDGDNAATATVTRSGVLTDSLFVLLSSSDTSEATVDSFVEIPAGQPSVTFPIHAVNDAFIDGDNIVTITVSASGFLNKSATLTVQDDGVDLPVDIVINEVESDSPGTDVGEFIELYNNSSTPRSLDGLVLVFFNGGANGDPVYLTVPLTGTIAGNGYFVVGNPAVPNVNVTVEPGSSGVIQNGQDAVALCIGAATDFPIGKAAGTVADSALIDAVVYGTDDADDAELIAALTPGSVQANEGADGINSIARLPDGGAAFNSALYVAQLPTPGATNVATGGSGFSGWLAIHAPGQAIDGDHDGDGIRNGLEYFFGATGSTFTPSPGIDATGKIKWPFSSTATDFVYVVQSSIDLVIWDPVPAANLDLVTNPGFITYTPPLPTPGSPKTFTRLQVGLPPP